jgi:hypothetical protein
MELGRRASAWGSMARMVQIAITSIIRGKNREK